MITWESLRHYANANNAPEADLTRAVAVAESMVTRVLLDAHTPMPEVVRDEAVLRVALNIFKASGSGDAGSFLGADGTPQVGLANDPLRKAWPLLKPYLNRL